MVDIPTARKKSTHWNNAVFPAYTHGEQGPGHVAQSMSSVTGSTPAIDSSPAPRRTAVLILRGWSDPVHRWGLNIPGGAISDSFRDLVREVFPQEEAGELLVPDLDLGTFSTADPNDLVAGLLRVVDARWNSQPFERLIIIGFSAGTLLARNLYATACGARAEPDGTVDASAARPWASRVERLVLVAGITRGWSISSATPALVRFVAPLALFFLNQWARWFCGRSPVLKRGPPPLIQQFKRGAPFVIESRLKLLQVERHVRQSAAGQLPHTVLLLGSKDEYVSPADAVDLGPRDGYTYIEVPESNHIALLHVQHARSTDDADKQRRAEQRAGLLLRALTQSPAQLADVAMKHADIDDWLDDMDRPVLPPDRAPEDPVDHVVFIVHGIRDNGFWTKRIGREVKELARRRQAPPRAQGSAPRTLVVSAPSPSYGFFSMWDFVNPWGREEATYWFLEKYAEVSVRWPDVPVSYIGHSNGTYLAANALADCRMVAFQRIVFAGSVVRTDYPWGDLGNRVGSVLNLVATADWVVACLPGAFERLGWNGAGVGGAGFDGFQEAADNQNAEATAPEVHNFCFIAGGHGAGIDEPVWPDIAAFIVDGTLPQQTSNDPARPRQRSPWQQRWARWATWAPLAIGAVVTGGAALLVALTDGVWLAVLAAAYVLLINNIVRFY